jgi:hypothetical protein
MGERVTSPHRRSPGPRGWLTALVVASATLLVAQGLLVTHPTVFADELVYSTAAEGLAEHGTVGAGYGYGLAYPLLLAPLYATLDGDAAYTVVKLVNGALFSLAAVPAYLLARRVARPGLAVAAAALAVLLPTRLLATFVLTESLAYLLFGVALVTMARALERPTVARQLVALAMVALAVQGRRQLVVLAAVLPLAILVHALSGRKQEPLRRALGRFAATWAGLGAAVTTVAVAAMARGSDGLLGPYDVLVRGYDATATAAWVAVHASALVALVGFVPLLALPLALPAALGSDASPGPRVVGALTAAAIPLVLLQVAAFTGTEYGLGLVHERNVFYVAPLLFALLAGWVDQGAPRPRPAFALVAAAVALMPFALMLRDARATAVDAPALFVLRYGTSGSPRVPLGTLVAAAVVIVVSVVLVRSRPTALLAVTAAFLALCAAVVQAPVTRSARDIEGRIAGTVRDRPRVWADEALGRDVRATLLTVVPTQACPSWEEDRASDQERLWSTVFFNRVPTSQLAIGEPLETALPLRRATVAPDGRILVQGAPVAEPLVLADSRLRLGGRRLHDDAATGLTAWAASAPLRIAGDPETVVCGAVPG